MKTIITSFLLFSSFPFMLTAQPVISNNEYYHNGDVIYMVPCNASGVGAGAQGASVVWDFSALVSAGGMSVTTVLNDTSTVFATCNILMMLPDGSKLHVQETSSESLIMGHEDGVTHLTTHYNDGYIASKRPFTFNTAYVDTYVLAIPATATTGKGFVDLRGDAYGTLILPTGTYNNVLRIRRFRTETDTTGPAVFTRFSTSYMWFDNTHAAPLFRLDSASSVAGNTQSAMYLAPPTAVQELNGGKGTYNGAFVNNTLFINGDFEARAQYEVTVCNIIGAKIFNERFVSIGNDSRQFDMGTQLNPGVYIVSISQINVSFNRHVFRVLKN